MEVANEVEVEISKGVVESNQTAFDLHSNVNKENENEVDALQATNDVQEDTSLTNYDIGSSVNEGTTSISPEIKVTKKKAGSSKTPKDGEVHSGNKKNPKAGLSQSLSFPSKLRKSNIFSKQTKVDVKNSHLSSSQRINGGASAKLTAGTKKPIPVKSGSVDHRSHSYPIKSNNDDMKPLEHTALGKKDDDVNSPTSTTPSTTPSGVTRRKSASSGFSFRLDERAERRKEFFAKLEVKIHAKELEKTNLQDKSKESQEAEIRRLRKSLTFKATPLPSFYQEHGPPKVELKKIPPTRPISPKLGRTKSVRAVVAAKSLDTGITSHASNLTESNAIVSDGKESSTASKRSTQKSLAKLPSLKLTTTGKSEAKPKPKFSNQKQRNDRAKEEKNKLTGEESQTEPCAKNEECMTVPGGFESVVDPSEAIEAPNDDTKELIES